MALYAFDGTWNRDKVDSIEDTNVVKFRDSYAGRCEYIQGVGTRYGLIGTILGGLFGFGGFVRTGEMYDRLVTNWENGDKEIDVIGFSRGAALAVNFCNVVNELGIRSAIDPAEKPVIRFLGVWDVVGSFGIPINLVFNFQEINIGYNLTVPDNVQQCFHAMALNERRQAFSVTRLDISSQKQNIEELWFRGVPNDVGGGYGNLGLSNIALRWMMEEGRECGLDIPESKLNSLDADINPFAPLSKDIDPIKNPRRTVPSADVLHPSAVANPIAPGESATFDVHAREKFNWSGVRAESGGYYSFEIPEGEQWRDKNIDCGPEGWPNGLLTWLLAAGVKLVEWLRRCKKANWFELIGAIGDGEENLFRIGRGGADATYRAPVDGDLFAFANDLPWFYGNNSGKIQVTVRRTADPGSTTLKTCKEA